MILVFIVSILCKQFSFPSFGYSNRTLKNMKQHQGNKELLNIDWDYASWPFGFLFLGNVEYHCNTNLQLYTVVYPDRKCVFKT